MKNNWMKPIKHFARSAFPSAYDRVQQWNWHRKYDPVYAAVDQVCGDRVMSGPFEGMSYLRQATGSAVLPKRLGVYEAELHPIISRLANTYECCMDIGCAEGYYAVGLAVRLGIPVFAFDVDPLAGQLCAELSDLNGVRDKVHVRQACTPEDLAALKGQRALIIADCEGFERELFTPTAATGLGLSDVLVETHDFLAPGASDAVIATLSASHDIQRIGVIPRSTESFAISSQFPPSVWALAVEEGRPASQIWLWATPRALSTRLQPDLH